MRFQHIECNMMQLTKKCTNKIQASYALEGTVLENVQRIKSYLGVTITNDLKWNAHINNICTKANRTIGFFRRTFVFLPPIRKGSSLKGSGTSSSEVWKLGLNFTYSTCLHFVTVTVLV